MPRWKVHFDMVVNTHHQLVVDRVARVHALASVIRGIPLPPYVQHRLDSLNIVRAVRGTTGIEGSDLSEEEVEKILYSQKSQPVLPQARVREEQEVKNANQLMVIVAQSLETNPGNPISEPMIRVFHKIITDGIDYPNNTPGKYRSHAVRAGTFVPPETGDEVRTLMGQFVQWFNTREPTAWDPIIRAIVAHFFVISIHPFGDGNGRTSRAVESYLLYQAGVNARGYYSLANYYYRMRPEYESMLDMIRFQSDPDMTPFVLFALEGLVEELESVHQEVLDELRIISFRDFARETLSGLGKLGTPIGERQLYFLSEIAKQPLSLKSLRSGKHALSGLYKGKNPRTFLRDIKFLEKHELVIIEGDQIRANLEIMTQFTAVHAPGGILESP